MPGFRELLHEIVETPTIFVGACSLRRVSDFLGGYSQAIEDYKIDENPLAGWFRWVELKFGVCDPGCGWTRILLHFYGGDEAALRALPELFDEFARLRQEKGTQGILALHRELFPGSESWRAPEHTQTRPSSEVEY